MIALGDIQDLPGSSPDQPLELGDTDSANGIVLSPSSQIIEIPSEPGSPFDAEFEVQDAWYRWSPASDGNFFFFSDQDFDRGDRSNFSIQVSEIGPNGSLTAVSADPSPQSIFIKSLYLDLEASKTYLVQLRINEEVDLPFFDFNDPVENRLGIEKQNPAVITLPSEEFVTVATTLLDLANTSDSRIYEYSAPSDDTYEIFAIPFQTIRSVRLNSVEQSGEEDLEVFLVDAKVGDLIEVELITAPEIPDAFEDMSSPVELVILASRSRSLSFSDASIISSGQPRRGVFSGNPAADDGSPAENDASVGIYRIDLPEDSRLALSFRSSLFEQSFVDVVRAVKPFDSLENIVETIEFTGADEEVFGSFRPQLKDGIRLLELEAGSYFFVVYPEYQTFGFSGIFELKIDVLNDLQTAESQLQEAALIATDDVLTQEARVSEILNEVDEAIASDPNHYFAILVKGLFEIESLRSDPQVDATLAALGFSFTNRTIDDLELAEPPASAASDLPSFPEGASLDDALQLLAQSFVPKVETLRGDLARAVESDAPESILGLAGEVGAMDRADALFVIIFLDNFLLLCDFLQTYNLDVSLNALVSLREAGELDLEEITNLDETLFRFADEGGPGRIASRVNEVRLMLTEAALESMTRDAESNLRFHLFAPDVTVDSELVVNAIEAVCELDAAFTGPTEIDGVTVDLSRWVEGASDLRSLLPSVKGNQFRGFTAPDATFSGIFPGSDQLELNEFFNKRNLLVEADGFVEFMESLVSQGRLFSFQTDPSDDPDRDGVSNLTEYFFARDPSIAQAANDLLQVGTLRQEDGNFLSVSFTRRISREDVRYVLAASDDLQNWDYSEAEVEVVGMPVPVGDGIGEIVTYRFSDSQDLNERKYLRVHAVGQ